MIAYPPFFFPGGGGGGQSRDIFRGGPVKNTLHLIYTKTDKMALQQWYDLNFMMPRTLNLVDICSSRMEPGRGVDLVRTVYIVVKSCNSLPK